MPFVQICLGNVCLDTVKQIFVYFRTYDFSTIVVHRESSRREIEFLVFPKLFAREILYVCAFVCVCLCVDLCVCCVCVSVCV